MDVKNYELTNPQKSIWNMEEFFEGTTINNVCTLAIIYEKINEELIKQALYNVVMQNDSFRIKINIENGMPVQYISEFEPFNIDFIHIKDESELDEIKQIEANYKFNIINSYLFKFTVTVFDNGYAAIILTVNHIIADSWSLGLTIKKILENYKALKNNEVLPNLESSYIDYINSETEYKNSNKYEQDKVYWDDVFKTIPEQAVFVSNKKIKNNISYEAKRSSFMLDTEIVEAIKSFCFENRISVFNFLMALYSIYLSRTTSLDDIVIGTPILNRSNFKEKQTTGMFVNTVPVKIHLNESENFKDFSHSLGLNMISILKHQKYSYNQILSDLRQKNTNVPNLYSVLISYQITKAFDANLGNYKTEWVFNNYCGNDFNIHITDINDTGKLMISYDYLIQKYDFEYVNNLHARIVYMTNQILNNHEIGLNNLEIVTPEEKNKILYEFNNTDVNYNFNNNIIEIIESIAKKYPNNIAIETENSWISYSDLIKRVNKLSNYLLKYNISQNTNIGIFTTRTIDTIIGILSILKINCTYVPIDSEYPLDRISYMIENSKIDCILSENIKNFDIISDIDNINKISINYSDYKNESDILYKEFSYNIDSNLYVIFTSGSTGKPKGVTITHKNMINLMFFEKNETDILKKDNCKILQFATMSFDVSYQEIYSSLLFGNTLVLIDDTTRKNMDKLSDYIINKKIDVLFIPPAYLKLLVENAEIRNKIISCVKNIITAGEALVITPGIRDLIESGITVHNHYGPAETHVATTYVITKDNIITYPPIGKPISNSNIHILDKTLHLCPINAIGQIAISGDCVGNGYWNNETLTNQKFMLNPYNNKKMYLTGDLGYFNDDGNIIFIGRSDFQVKLNGFRVELDEIDQVLLKNSNIKSSISITHEENNKKYIITYYIEKSPTNNADLIKYLNAYLPSYMIPKRLVKLDSFPINANGKIDKKNLPKVSLSDVEEDFVKPNTDMEIKLANIWKQLFNIDNISANSNFFEIGGDSLLAIKLCSMISANFNVDIKIKDLFDNSILSELAKFIEDKQFLEYNRITNCIKKDSYILSSAQKRVYFASKIAGENSCLYNMPAVIIFDRTPDVKKLNKCFNELIKRHSSLRTYFEIADGEICQKIQDKIDFELETIDLANKQLNDIIKDFVKPFNLSYAPLLRTKLVSLKNKTLLLFDMHHIISDGLSLSILTTELCKLYNNEALEPISFNYVDYAEWENNNLKNNTLKECKDFWINKFKDNIPVLDLPTDFSRPAIQSFSGDKVYKITDKDLTNKIINLAKKLNVSNYIFLLAVYYILLSKYTSQEDIVVGTPIVGRNKEELLNIIGMFVSTLALRNHIDNNVSFNTFLNSLKDDFITSLEYQSYPFDELVNDLGIARDASRNPLFDTMFTYQNNGITPVNFNGLTSEIYIPDTNTSKFDLSLEVVPSNGELKLNFEYCTALFNKSTIERFSNHFINILKAVVDNPDIKISDIDMLSEEEKNQIMFNFNDTKLIYPKNKTILQLFEEQVEKTPNNIAVEYEDKQLTYKELNEKSNKLALDLINSKVKEGDVIGVLLSRNVELVISIFAILKCNAIYLPLYIDYPDDRINYMLKNSNSKLVITNNSLKNKLDLSFNTIILDNFNDINNLNQFEHKYNMPDDIIYIIYTSGSTGKPKGVQITNKNLNNFVHSFNEYFVNIKGDDKFLSSTSISFDVSIFELFLPLLNGSTLVLYHNELIKDILDFCNYFIKHKITALYIPPNILNEVFSILKAKKGIKINKLLVGVESIKKETLNKYFLLNPNMCIINGYGPTETTICSTALRYIKEIDNTSDIVSIGKPLYNDNIYILDKNMKLVPIGVPGELYVTGDGVGKGYINNDIENNNHYLNNSFDNTSNKMYKTGDIGKWNLNGTISLIGRKDSQVKISGHRIELKEIDNVIMNYPGIQKNITIISEIGTKKYIVSYFTAENKVNIDNLISFLQSKLPNYMIPSSILQLDSFPLTSNGKIDKTKLPDAKLQSRVQYIAPRNDFEKSIIDIWKKIFLIDKIGIDDNFFDLGGDSLTAIKFQAEAINLGLNITYSDIFSYSTPRQLSEKIDPNNSTNYDDVYYDYSKIQELISINKIENLSNLDTSIKNPGNILLFGATGFLGSHILDKYLSNEKDGIAYCIIRKKSNTEPAIRLKKILNYYFGSKYDDEFGRRIIVVNGDITKYNFSLTEKDYNDLAKNVSIVIDSAAIVKHYGDLEKFRDININGTINVINFCNEFKKKLYYISTLSVSGNISKEDTNDEEFLYFKETDFYINQNLNNVYIYSKFKAEKKIFEAMENGLDACVLRIGNITNRYSDSKFQFNIAENAFVNRLKSIIRLGIVQDKFLSHSLEFTPVDTCAEAIIKIIDNNPKFTLFHLFDDNFIKITRLIEILNTMNEIKIKPVSDEVFSNKIDLFLNDVSTRYEISGIITDLNENKLLDLINYIIPDSTFSKAYLHALGFEWPIIDYDYIKNYIDYFKDINYI